MSDSGVLSVAIIEDQPRILDGLRMLIDGSAGFRCTAGYGSMEEALAEMARDLPDVALIDIGLPGMSGIDGTRLLKQRHPALSIVMLTIYEDDKRIFEALCAGACGYLLKMTPPARLLESLQEAAGGGAPMTPRVARKVVALFRKVRPPEDAEYDLSAHEIRLLKLLVDGHNCRTAAVELGVSVHGISFHMRNIYEKLQVHSKSEAVAKALRAGLVR